MFVGDVVNYRIQKFTNTGKFIRKWGSLGSGNGQFDTPSGVAVDPSGNVFVTDLNNFRIQKFTNTGTFIKEWGIGSPGNTSVDVAVDPSGNVFVATDVNSILKLYEYWYIHWRMG